MFNNLYIDIYTHMIPVVPHKAVAEVWKRGNFIAVNAGWQSEPTDGPTSGWRQRSVVVVEM